MQENSKTFKMTRAGRMYMRFLTAFNTGDAETMREFILSHCDPFAFDDDFEATFITWYVETFKQTGGLRILRNYLSEEFYIIVIVESLKDGRHYLDKLAVTREMPHLITEYNHSEAQAQV
jgi:hypothetical protein